MTPANISLSGNACNDNRCNECRHLVLQADGQVVSGPCKKTYDGGNKSEMLCVAILPIPVESVPEEQKGCWNCRHDELNDTEQPCRDCITIQCYEHWQPEEGAPTELAPVERFNAPALGH